MEELRGCAGVGKAPPWAPSGVGTSAPTTNLNRKKKKKLNIGRYQKREKIKKKATLGIRPEETPKN